MITTLPTRPAGDVPDAARRWRGVRRVLAVRLDNIGDVLMTTPALAAIKQSVPDAELSLLASSAGTVIAGCVPQVDHVITFDAPWVKPPVETVADDLGVAEARLVDRLAALRFDAAVIFTVCTQSALPAAMLCRLAGIPLRLAHCRENPYGLLSDWVPDGEVVASGMRHEVERQLALVGAVGWHTDDDRLRLRLDAAAWRRTQQRLQGAGLAAGAPYFVVHVGATATSRRYPADRFGLAARRIADDGGGLAVFTGDHGERMLVEEARAAMGGGSISLVGELPIAELATLIAGARLLVANNTGPMHIAAATQTPVVALYALTNPQHTPWKVASRVLSHDVPCRNCLKSVCPEGHHDCLRRIVPMQVGDAAASLMGWPLAAATADVVTA